MIGRITAYIESTADQSAAARNAQEPIGHVYLYAAFLFVGATVQSLAIAQYFQRGYRLGLRARAGIGQLVYRKSLCVPTRNAQRNAQHATRNATHAGRNARRDVA
jgi:hypothetical protein